MKDLNECPPPNAGAKSIEILVSNIKDYMSMNKMSTYRLSQLAHIDLPLIYKFLAGRSQDIKLSSIDRYARALQVSAADLLTPSLFKQKKI